MIDIKLKLPKEIIDENGFTPSQNRELEKYIANRPSFKESNGAWKRFVESEKLAEKKQKDHLKKLIKFGIEESSKPVIKNPVLREALEPKVSEPKIFKDNINNRKVAKIPVIPPKPDLMNGHSDWSTDDWLQSIDPGGWASDEDKRVQVDENLFEKYLELIKKGELLPNTTFEMFEKNYHDFDTDIISRINKKALENKKREGLAAILGISPSRI
tara:strand:+ start:642 stop:1283 length:642 start_codon:yes stop_codon:yes gene_type:complete